VVPCARSPALAGFAPHFSNRFPFSRAVPKAPEGWHTPGRFAHFASHRAICHSNRNEVALLQRSSNILTHAPEALKFKLIFAATLCKNRFRSLPVGAH
jgi:hypothetical protein